MLLASTGRYSFVQEDIAALSRHFTLDVHIASGLRGALSLFRHARRADVAFGWFGSVYTFFMVMGARSHGGRSIVMLGGADVANEPELHYGVWRSWWKGRVLATALRRADRIFAVDMALRAMLERSSGRRWERVEELPTGYDAAAWTPCGAVERRVLCVAGCHTEDRSRVKGVDLIFEAARRLPDVPFTVIGPEPDLAERLAAIAPPNVAIIARLPRAELLEHYRRARVYCQPSRSEGLPNALCEAMLCGAVPVVTAVGGMPNAVGECGYIVPRGEIDPLCDAILQALDAPADRGAASRERIARLFTRERRERTLVAAIQELARGHAAT